VNRITAQVACEAIVNHPHDGWDVATMEAVLVDAREVEVPPLYVEMLEETLASRRIVEAAFSGRSDGGDDRGPETVRADIIEAAWERCRLDLGCDVDHGARP